MAFIIPATGGDGWTGSGDLTDASGWFSIDQMGNLVSINYLDVEENFNRFTGGGALSASGVFGPLDPSNGIINIAYGSYSLTGNLIVGVLDVGTIFDTANTASLTIENGTTISATVFLGFGSLDGGYSIGTIEGATVSALNLGIGDLGWGDALGLGWLYETPDAANQTGSGTSVLIESSKVFVTDTIRIGHGGEATLNIQDASKAAWRLL
jgi:hypothetical protein